jgi:hypothetical protein
MAYPPSGTIGNLVPGPKSPLKAKFEDARVIQK